MLADWRRTAPIATALALATVYVLVSPPSLDLAAHLLRAKLFRTEGFAIWSNWWYAGHHLPSYSVLFPAAAGILSPQLAAGIAAVGSAAIFAAWVRDRFGEDAWLGALWFGAATATNLFTGRLAFAFGLLPALGAAWSLARGKTWLAWGLGVVTALSSPVAALFAGLAGAAHALGAILSHDRPRSPRLIAGVGLIVFALSPFGLLAVAFPEGGSEPFTFATLWPIVLIGVIALIALPGPSGSLRAGVTLYLLGCLLAYSVSTPVGSNAARLGSLMAGPLAALIWWPRRTAVLAIVTLPLLYLQWQAPVRDVRTASGDPSDSAAYYRPLLGFLARQPGPPFRIEIPFTLFHWEAYQVAPRFPIARGWERQLDIEYNGLFYRGRLTPALYERWLHETAVRFVAVSDARLDYSARREAALITGGLSYLRPVFSSRHWRVYAVRDPTPIVSGDATLRGITVNSVSLDARRPGEALLRVHYTPYWALATGAGCVEPAGSFTRLTLRAPGEVRLVIRFALDRIRSRTPRCA